MNISSAIVYAQPDQETAVRAAMAAMPGVEVHAASSDGKLVVTLECDNDRSAMDQYDAIARAPGVQSVAMVYQHTESHPDQEI